MLPKQKEAFDAFYKSACHSCDWINAIKTIVMAVSIGRIMMQFDEVLNSEVGGCMEYKGCDD